MTSNIIAKIVQPTATVSSVPVNQPTTGIARSITSSQSLRTGIATAPIIASIPQVAIQAQTVAALSNDTATAAGAGGAIASAIHNSTTVAQTSQAAAINAAAPSPAKMQPTATIQRAPGGKYSALAAAAAAGHSLDNTTSPHPVPIAVPPVTVPAAGARGLPPPIPPNKPIVPPKREPSLSRLGSITGASSAAAAATTAAAAAANVKN